MEVITSINEIKPGEASALHVHHGEESFYVVEGGMIELKDGKQVPFPAGTTGINVRDVPHGAFKVVGDKGNKVPVRPYRRQGSAALRYSQVTAREQTIKHLASVATADAFIDSFM